MIAAFIRILHSLCEMSQYSRRYREALELGGKSLSYARDVANYLRLTEHYLLRPLKTGHAGHKCFKMNSLEIIRTFQRELKKWLLGALFGFLTRKPPLRAYCLLNEEKR